MKKKMNVNFNLVVHSVGQIKDLIISGCTVHDCEKKKSNCILAYHEGDRNTCILWLAMNLIV